MVLLKRILLLITLQAISLTTLASVPISALIQEKSGYTVADAKAVAGINPAYFMMRIMFPINSQGAINTPTLQAFVDTLSKNGFTGKLGFLPNVDHHSAPQTWGCLLNSSIANNSKNCMDVMTKAMQAANHSLHGALKFSVFGIEMESSHLPKTAATFNAIKTRLNTAIPASQLAALVAASNVGAKKGDQKNIATVMATYKNVDIIFPELYDQMQSNSDGTLLYVDGNQGGITKCVKNIDHCSPNNSYSIYHSSNSQQYSPASSAAQLMRASSNKINASFNLPSSFRRKIIWLLSYDTSLNHDYLGQNCTANKASPWTFHKVFGKTGLIVNYVNDLQLPDGNLKFGLWKTACVLAHWPAEIKMSAH